MSKPTVQQPEIEVLYSARTIADRIAMLAREIRSAEFRDLVVVAILNGSFIFAADLIRALHREGLSPEVDFLTLSSYRSGTTSSGSVAILRDVRADVAGRDVLLVDDILESGRTLGFAVELLQSRMANRVESCVLMNKEVERAVPIKADYKGFDCPDEFVVGYGMDLAYRHRELPFVGRIVKAPLE